MTMQRQQSSTTHPMSFMLVLASDHISPATGKSPTVTISKDGGSYAAPSGAVTEIGNGRYALAGNATDRNTIGELSIHVTEASSDPTDATYDIVPYDPFAAQLPANVTGWLGTAPTTPHTAGVPIVSTDYRNGQAVLLDGNNLPKVDVEDWHAAAVASLPANFSLLAIDTGGAVPANNLGALLDTALSGHTTGGTAGAALGNLVNALTESYAANGQPATLAQLLYEILAVLANVSQSGTSIVATKLDGATPAMSFTLDSATAPTSRKRVA